ncbi:MAG: prolyl oligopeptidase family serine peptidase, partial [Verrucomicrobiales bacterium]|nr:prolyl oligopeptidase family serine peptidase [Verrucomicrobiales bacterium]
ENSAFSSHTFNGSRPHPPRLSPTNLVAEVDQLRLGTLLIAPLDPFVDRSQATRLRDVTTAVYTDLHATSPSLIQSGSQLGAGYQDVFASPRFQHHFFRYKPANSKAATPAIIFLHGSLGNFQAYIHLLKPVADQLGATLIAPTFGAGEWSRPEAPQTIQKAIGYCRSQPDIDANNITLIGLSNGGIGVTHALNNFPGHFTSFIYLSPVIPTKNITAVPADKPVLVIHGTADRRIPLTSVQSATAHLEKLGADVTTHLHHDEDHFLFFSKPDPVIDQITRWLETR